MSRIGNKAITIPAGVEITIAEGNEVTVKGPKGTLTKKFSPLMDIAVEDGVLTVKRPNEEKQTKQLHGTTRALLNAMIEGVDKTFTKQLKIVGIGYRAALAGNKLTLNVGFSHPVEFTVPSDVKVEVPDATTINVSGIDKQIVGQFAAVVRATKKPEPYGGKGIMYKDEHVRRKEGKTAASKK
ncbi:MAG: 50S ribosomal protein L6 [Erysipelotrichaceae bacterium]|jgi:large subunit ribosomal protein L6|nr:50S ribosomal protein L6 [Erysipelotrichaceae bacterium]